MDGMDYSWTVCHWNSFFFLIRTTTRSKSFLWNRSISETCGGEGRKGHLTWRRLNFCWRFSFCAFVFGPVNVSFCVSKALLFIFCCRLRDLFPLSSEAHDWPWKKATTFFTRGTLMDCIEIKTSLTTDD